jgi:hypothetical protein
VRVRIPIAAAFMTVGWLAACSKPASQGGHDAHPNTGARDILLAEAPSTEGAVVSDLEARNAPRSAPARGVARKNVDRQALLGREAAPAAAGPDHAAMAAPAPVQEMSRTATATTDIPLRLAMATAPAAPIFGEARPLNGDVGGAGDTRALPEFAGRGPVIILRGGRGGIDDDCDLHGPRARRPGVAINRTAPSLGGGGIGRTGMLRGGIR